MIIAKLARRSRLTGGSPARVSPKMEYSPVFARPSASATALDTFAGTPPGRSSRPLRDRLPAAPVKDIVLLQVEKPAWACAIDRSSIDHYRDDASQVSHTRG